MNCEICNKKYFNYKCPKCSIKYCSLKCFQNHNNYTCYDNFCKFNVEQHLKGKKLLDKKFINKYKKSQEDQPYEIDPKIYKKELDNLNKIKENKNYDISKLTNLNKKYFMTYINNSISNLSPIWYDNDIFSNFSIYENLSENFDGFIYFNNDFNTKKKRNLLFNFYKDKIINNDKFNKNILYNIYCLIYFFIYFYYIFIGKIDDFYKEICKKLIKNLEFLKDNTMFIITSADDSYENFYTYFNKRGDTWEFLNLIKNDFEIITSKNSKVIEILHILYEMFKIYNQKKIYNKWLFYSLFIRNNFN